LKRYNHGVRVDDDTRTWGTPTDSWLDMAKEELLDAIIYTIADYIRNFRTSSLRKNDDNELIMSIVDNWEHVESPQHKMLLSNLFEMLNSPLLRKDTLDQLFHSP